MTQDELQAHKEKIKKVMTDHLTQTCGWPECSPEQVMAELKPMWVKIEEAGLVLPGMNFQHFFLHADHHFMLAKIHELTDI